MPNYPFLSQSSSNTHTYQLSHSSTLYHPWLLSFCEQFTTVPLNWATLILLDNLSRRQLGEKHCLLLAVLRGTVGNMLREMIQNLLSVSVVLVKGWCPQVLMALWDHGRRTQSHHDGAEQESGQQELSRRWTKLIAEQRIDA